MIKGEVVAIELCKHGIPWFVSNCLFGPMNEGEMEKSQALMVSLCYYLQSTLEIYLFFINEMAHVKSAHATKVKLFIIYSEDFFLFVVFFFSLFFFVLVVFIFTIWPSSFFPLLLQDTDAPQHSIKLN